MTDEMEAADDARRTQVRSGSLDMGMAGKIRPVLVC